MVRTVGCQERIMISEVNVPSFDERGVCSYTLPPPPILTHPNFLLYTYTQGRVFWTALPLYQLTRAR